MAGSAVEGAVSGGGRPGRDRQELTQWNVWCPGPGALEVRWRGGGWLGPPRLITSYFRHDVLNIRVVDQAHLFTSWKVPGDSGFINEGTG